MPQRIRLQRTAGWRLADHTTNYVIVDRRGIWGNPWTLCRSGKQWLVLKENVWPVVAKFDTKAEAQAYAVDIFRRWLTDAAFAEQHPGLGWDRDWILERLDYLDGKDLCCWCREAPCHAEVYFELLAARTGGAR